MYIKVTIGDLIVEVNDDQRTASLSEIRAVVAVASDAHAKTV